MNVNSSIGLIKRFAGERDWMKVNSSIGLIKRFAGGRDWMNVNNYRADKEVRRGEGLDECIPRLHVLQVVPL